MIRVWLHFPWGLIGCGQEIPSGESELLLPQGTTVRYLLDSQGISPNVIGLISVNGSATKIGSVLQDQDKVQIYPPLEGG